MFTHLFYIFEESDLDDKHYGPSTRKAVALMRDDIINIDLLEHTLLFISKVCRKNNRRQVEYEKYKAKFSLIFFVVKTPFFFVV
jgi:hypothetical protein